MKSRSRITLTLLFVALMLAVVLPAHTLAVDTGDQRVLIRYAATQRGAFPQALEQAGGQVHHVFEELNVVAASLPSSAIEAIQENAAVLSIEADQPRFAADQVVPYGVESVEARLVWDADYDGLVDTGAPTGAGRTVCIIDSGVDITHEDFSGVNFVGGYPSNWNTDTCGHGTHVAGTIAAMNNTTGIVGVTPGAASLYIVKVFGDNCDWTYSSDLMDAAFKCRDAGADIINMSLTGSLDNYFEEYVFQMLYDQGILSIAAAGNGGGTAYGYPASYDPVISVGAVDASNTIADFSRQNDQVELTAPGVGILSTYLNGGYVYMSGTSMAAPHVSAAAAVVWSADPDLSNAELRGLLQETALDQGAPGRDVAYGYGVIRSRTAVDQVIVPTAIDLASFAAEAQDGAIQVTWETVEEIDNLGFDLYRATSRDGARTQLNDTLIPSQVAPGSPTGAVYTWLDEDVEAGLTYYYWLEDVDASGAITRHGPVQATLSTLVFETEEAFAIRRIVPSRPAK
ncbi:MAG: S8 family serine peptidase [Anaerolineae bacterium]|jgi:hypothetical protein